MKSDISKVNKDLSKQESNNQFDIDKDNPIGQLFLSKNNDEIIKITSKHEEYNGYYCDLLVDFDNLAFKAKSKNSTLSFSDLKSFYKHISNEEFHRYHEATLEYFKTGDLSKYEKLVNKSESDQSNSLMVVNSKEQLTALQNNLEQNEIMLSSIKTMINVKKAEAERMLNAMRRNLEGVLVKFQEEIKKVTQLIQTIEIYLGINEDIYQIQSGQSAPDETPISFRQQVLYMDEEVAVYDNGGWDILDIPLFDKWLLENNNYDDLIPEQKGVVVFKPRRYEKSYGSSHESAQMSILNRTTYILIRNGENLYRIHSENIRVGNTLFPIRKEFEELLSKANEESAMESDVKKLDETIFSFKKTAILMQGLIDRSEILHPLPVANVSIFKMEEFGSYFNFIYDAEMLLPSGRISFREWQLKQNACIEHGSRIIISSNIRSEFQGYTVKETSYYEKYFILAGRESYRYQRKLPNLPNENEIYSIESFQDSLTFKYPDSRTVWDSDSWEERPRKNKVRFVLFPSANYVLNYDYISLEDVNFYIKSRVDRHQYLSMMPVLHRIKFLKQQELEAEKPFIDMCLSYLISNEPICQTIKQSELTDIVYETVEWWKLKNKIKRGIKKDEPKAFRMICKKVVQTINERTEKTQ
jgi:hypothetical protein